MVLLVFNVGGVDVWSWFWKLFFMVVMFVSGFKGGEVMLLFFIGVILGNMFVVLLGVLVDFFVGFGFFVVFVGVINMLLVCMFMGIEFFGVYYMVYFVVVCFVVYYCSGYLGIYGV